MEPNKYELGVVVRADLDEDTLQSEMERVRGLLDRFGATIEKEDKWGRRRLAYPIEKHTEGVYTFITYTAQGTTPREVESRLRLMENVLRFLTININDVEAKKAKAKKDEPFIEVEEETAAEQAVEVEETVADEAAVAADEVTETLEVETEVEVAVEVEAEVEDETEVETEAEAEVEAETEVKDEAVESADE